MHFLVSISDNVQEWQDAVVAPADKPRLPIPYAFGAALVKNGHKLSAIDVTARIPRAGALGPFEAIYSVNEMPRAMNKVDLALLWGGQGASAIMRQVLARPFRKRVVLASYVWQLKESLSPRNIKAWIGARMAARFARALTTMTVEQAELARMSLSTTVPVVSFRCGIDTAFYRVPSVETHVPNAFHQTVEKLLAKPYMMTPGSQLRSNVDALTIVAKTGIPLVRIAPEPSSELQKMHLEAKRLGIDDRVFIFTGISYQFMRFLLQHASFYAGFVNSNWQPAGWTVACEALACGLPVITYEGLVSREMARIGSDRDFFRSVPVNDIQAFAEVAESFIDRSERKEIANRAQCFAAEFLDCETTGKAFVEELERIL